MVRQKCFFLHNFANVGQEILSKISTEMQTKKSAKKRILNEFFSKVEIS